MYVSNIYRIYELNLNVIYSNLSNMEWESDGVSEHQRVHAVQAILHDSVRLTHFVDSIYDFLLGA